MVRNFATPTYPSSIEGNSNKSFILSLSNVRGGFSPNTLFHVEVVPKDMLRRDTSVEDSIFQLYLLWRDTIVGSLFQLYLLRKDTIEGSLFQLYLCQNAVSTRGYKWVLRNMNMTHDIIWGENKFFCSNREPSTVICYFEHDIDTQRPNNFRGWNLNHINVKGYMFVISLYITCGIEGMGRLITSM